MTPEKFSSLAGIIILLGCSCASSHLGSDTKASVDSIRRYVDSFKGLSPEAVRSRLVGVKLVEEDWREEGIGGEQLVATFPDYELRVLFFDNKVVTTSVQVLSK